MKDKIYIGCVKDGSIITFPNSYYYFMKVCGKNGIGGVVNLYSGRYYTYPELEAHSLGTECNVVGDNLDVLFNEDD